MRGVETKEPCRWDGRDCRGWKQVHIDGQAGPPTIEGLEGGHRQGGVWSRANGEECRVEEIIPVRGVGVGEEGKAILDGADETFDHAVRLRVVSSREYLVGTELLADGRE